MAYRLLAGVAASALLLGSAASGDDWGRNNRGWDRGYDRHHHNRHRDNDGDDAALLGGGAILGLVVGSALADGGGSSRSTYSYGYSQPSYGYGSNNYGYDYTYSQPNYGYSQPSYGYAQPSYGYAPPAYQPAPAYNYAPPVQTYAAAPKACPEVRSGRTATGAVIGGVLGGLLGSGVAANGAREEGTAVGALVGAGLGGSIGHSTSNCNNSAGYYQAGYTPPPGVIGGPLGAPSYPSQGYPPQQGYGYENDLYGGPGYEPGYDDYTGSSGAYAGEECERTTRITRMPDGSEINEPVTVCRQANYDGWSVQN